MPVEGPSRLAFDVSRTARPKKLRDIAPHSIWVAVAVLVALAFLLLVRAMFPRPEWSAAPSFETAHQPDLASDAELKSQLWSEVAAPEAGGSLARASPPQVSPIVSPQRVVYRCVTTDGKVSLQSVPCTAAADTSRVVEVDPALSGRGQTSPLYPSSYLPSGGSARLPPVQDPRRARCEEAKRHRAAVLERVGLKRTFDLLRQLDDEVYEACKGLW